MRPRLALVALLLIAAATVSVVGCGGGKAAGLEGTAWRLTEWTVSSLAPTDFTITATFADGKISGTSAVNSYGGSYAAGPNGDFSVGELASTLMAADEPAMRAETAYMTLLAQAKSYEVKDGTLTLHDAGGNESLIFTAATK